jgi:protein SCO1/2
MLLPALGLLVLVPWGGCGRDGAAADRGRAASAGRAPAPAPMPAVKTFPLVGVVLGVDKDEGVVRIRHEAIPGVMGAMAMPFTLKDRDVLDDLQEGDEVQGTLRATFAGAQMTDYDLADLAVTRPAPPPALSLDFSAGAPVLRPRPPVLRPGEPVPDFAVTTQDGRALRLSDLRGHVVVLTFLYTRCPVPDFCPLQDRKFAELAAGVRAVPGRAEAVRLLSVSFDPEHDTPEVLARHARLQGARAPLWTFAVASHEELRRVAEPLGLMYAPLGAEIVHGLSTAVIAPDGTLARREAGKGWTSADLLKTINALISPSRK